MEGVVWPGPQFVSIMRATLFLAAVFLLSNSIPSHAALMGSGDIAFIGFSSDVFEDFSFVTLVDIDPGSVVYFREGNWTGTAFSPLEGAFEWYSGLSTISSGTVVSFRNIRDGGTQSLSHGQFSSFTGTFDMSGSNDELWAYLGPNISTPSSFLSMIANETVGATGGPILTNTGLIDGTTAQIIDGDFDVMAYVGPRSGQSSFADFLPIISNPLNWTVSNDVGSLVPFDSTAFTVSSTPVPEPSALVLAIGGLLTFGASKRRRRAD